MAIPYTVKDRVCMSYQSCKLVNDTWSVNFMRPTTSILVQEKSLALFPYMEVFSGKNVLWLW